MGTRISDITGGASSVHSDIIEVREIDPDTTEVALKPEGFSSKTIGTLFFALFWNGFLVVWTALALQGSLMFAAFSLPFWFIGIMLLIGIVVAIFGKQKIIIRRNEMVLQKIILARHAQQIISYGNLISIENTRQVGGKKTTKLMASSSPDSGLLSKTPTIIYDKSERKELMFAEHLSKADQEWLVDYLNEKIVPLMKFVR